MKIEKSFRIFFFFFEILLFQSVNTTIKTQYGAGEQWRLLILFFLFVFFFGFPSLFHSSTTYCTLSCLTEYSAIRQTSRVSNPFLRTNKLKLNNTEKNIKSWRRWRRSGNDDDDDNDKKSVFIFFESLTAQTRSWVMVFPCNKCLKINYNKIIRRQPISQTTRL